MNRWYWYFNGGSYTNPSIYLVGQEVKSEWKDEAWMDWNADFFWYYYDYPGAGANLLSGNAVVRDNGSHRFVGAASSRIIWDKVNPGNYGIHNKYIQACTRPFFTNYPIYGPWGCSSLIWYN